MRKRNEQLFLVGVGLLLAGFLLTRRRQCGAGCQTLVKHVIDRGLQDLVAGLLM